MVSTYALRTSQPRMNMRQFSQSVKTLYRSSRFGYTVTGPISWDSTGAGSSGSDPDTDSVLLTKRGADHADIGIVAADRWNVLDTAETVRFWTSEEYLSEFVEPGTIVVLSDRTRTCGGAVLVSPGVPHGDAIVTAKEAFDIGQNISIRVSLTADIEAFPEVYRSVTQALRINGQSVMGCFSRDVLEAVLS